MGVGTPASQQDGPGLDPRPDEGPLCVPSMSVVVCQPPHLHFHSTFTARCSLTICHHLRKHQNPRLNVADWSVARWNHL